MTRMIALRIGMSLVGLFLVGCALTQPQNFQMVRAASNLCHAQERLDCQMPTP